VWSALEKWEAFNKKRDTDVDRFKVQGTYYSSYIIGPSRHLVNGMSHLRAEFVVVVLQLHDPRDYSAREEEVALLKDLKKVLQSHISLRDMYR
jgi:hypothetical protein